MCTISCLTKLKKFVIVLQMLPLPCLLYLLCLTHLTWILLNRSFLTLVKLFCGYFADFYNLPYSPKLYEQAYSWHKLKRSVILLQVFPMPCLPLPNLLPSYEPNCIYIFFFIYFELFCGYFLGFFLTLQYLLDLFRSSKLYWKEF